MLCLALTTGHTIGHENFSVKENKLAQRYGNLVRIPVYVEPDMYEALRTFAPPKKQRWESTLVRRIIEEFLDSRGVKWKKPLTPLVQIQPGQSLDVVKDAPASTTSHGRRARSK